MKFPVNNEIIDFAKEKAKEFNIEIDETLCNHLGFLFARDALVVFKDRIELTDEFSTEHFEVNRSYHLYKKKIF